MSLFGDIASVAGLGSLANTVGNIWSSHKQWQLGNETLAWNKAAQEKTWKREDNAVQRRAADLNAAGMNRLLAAGSGAASSSPIHIGTPDAMDLSGIGNGLTSYVETKMALNKQRADIAHTDAQRKLLEGQLAGVEKQNSLLQLQLDWYKNHPGFAPGVEGSFGSGKGVSSTFSAARRELEMFGEKVGHLIAQRAHPTYKSVYNYHRSQGLSDVESARRATKFINNHYK